MTPDDLEAVFDRTTDLVFNWWDCEQWADNAPASERDDARGVADTAKHEVLQYLSHLVSHSPEYARLVEAEQEAAAAEAYRHMIGADLSMEERRLRGKRFADNSRPAERGGES